MIPASQPQLPQCLELKGTLLCRGPLHGGGCTWIGCGPLRSATQRRILTLTQTLTLTPDPAC